MGSGLKRGALTLPQHNLEALINIAMGILRDHFATGEEGDGLWSGQAWLLTLCQCLQAI